MIVVLDNGHGGMINGKYQTPGKRSPKGHKGILFEGMFNRWVVNRLIEKLDRAQIPYFHASPELTDVSLNERIVRVNNIHKEKKNVYLVSIHANAGGGQGIEGFTTPGNTPSDDICEMFLKDLEIYVGSTQKMRFDYSDGDRDKEERFAVLTKTVCPAILIECGFMDNPEDYKKLFDPYYLKCVVDSLFSTIQKINKI